MKVNKPLLIGVAAIGTAMYFMSKKKEVGIASSETPAGKGLSGHRRSRKRTTKKRRK